MAKEKAMKNKIIIEFFTKLGIMCVVSFILGVIGAICEVWLNWDISLFVHFTLGYLSCLIFNWRWFVCLREKEKRK